MIEKLIKPAAFIDDLLDKGLGFPQKQCQDLNENGGSQSEPGDHFFHEVTLRVMVEVITVVGISIPILWNIVIRVMDMVMEGIQTNRAPICQGNLVGILVEGEMGLCFSGETSILIISWNFRCFRNCLVGVHMVFIKQRQDVDTRVGLYFEKEFGFLVLVYPYGRIRLYET